MRKHLRRFNSFALFFLAAALVFTAGCATTMRGEVEEDITLTEQTEELERLGAEYDGPQYTIAILEFDNKTPSKVLGVGEAATDIMRTVVKKAGLEPIVLTREEMREQERLMELQQTGALKTGRKSAGEGFESVDYRISGSVTSYAEVEESSQAILVQSKTRIARVQVDYALVDVATGRTLVADSGAGIYEKKTGGVLGLGTKTTADPGLRDGALRDALTKAMTSMVGRLNSVPYTGRVLDVDGATVFVRAGTRSRLAPGTVLRVYRAGKDLVDPETGRVIGTRERLIGEVFITRHQNERVSVAEATSGSGFSAGDMVREKKPRNNDE